MAKKVRFGLSNVYISARTESELGVVTYSTPVACEGAVSLTLTRSNEKVVKRADNINFFTRVISSSREGVFTLTYIPDWFKTAYLGYKADSNGKLIETNAEGGQFAIGFQIEIGGQTQPEKYVVYNCVGAEGDSEFATTEENDLAIKDQTINLTMSGEIVDNLVCYIAPVDSLTTAPSIPTWPVSV